MTEQVNRNGSEGNVPGTVNAITMELHGLTKRYGAHIALDSVDVTTRAGEFIALLGPNGAGKSTLIKLIAGVLTPDAGSMRFGEGISAGVVHQDLGLFDDMSVVENLFIGEESKSPIISFARENRRAVELLRFVGLTEVSPVALIRDLSLGERALVAVAKLWAQETKLIIVDEVTASLPRAEAAWVVDHLRTAAHSGATVIMVTHRFEDVLGNVDRFVVVVDGKIAMDQPGEGVTRDGLVDVISSGISHAEVGRRDISTRSPGEVVVTLDRAGVNKIRPLSLELRRGQITGVAGSSVSGFHDVGYLVAGTARARHGGVKVLNGAKVTCLPAHRDADGIFPDQTVEFNMSVGNLNRWRTLGLINLSRMQGAIADAAKRLNVIPANTDAVITTLSGGNQQKALLGRVIADDPVCVVLCEPTRGVDVGTRREIYAYVTKLADEGCAVMVVSSDMEDLEALSDRIVVIGDEGDVEMWVEANDIEAFCNARSALG